MAPSQEKKTRKPSPYNEYMRKRISSVKAEQPQLSHKEAFKAAAEQWKYAPENPKRTR